MTAWHPDDLWKCEILVTLLDWPRCIPNANGEEYCELHGGWISGAVCVNRLDDLSLVKVGMELATPILRDLIAELRPYQRYALTDYTVIARALDRAEARLREVTG